MDNVSILEVGPRDGLQNEQSLLTLEEKIEFVRKLSQTGLNRIELGSFVSPKWIPQMQDTGELVREVLKDQEERRIPKHIQFSALVPNEKGLQRALRSKIKEISIFLSATDSFSKKNINCSTKESYTKYKALCKEALKENLKIRAYLSVCFHCPYEEKVSQEKVIEWIQKIEDLSVYEMAISDTTGKANAEEVQSLLEKLLNFIPKKKLACHFHNVHGMALANVWAAYQLGIRSFDGSLGGLGGCPYSKMPSGNVPTEALFYLLKRSEENSIKKLIEIGLWLESKLTKKLPSVLLHSPYYRKENNSLGK